MDKTDDGVLMLVCEIMLMHFNTHDLKQSFRFQWTLRCIFNQSMFPSKVLSAWTMVVHQIPINRPRWMSRHSSHGEKVRVDRKSCRYPFSFLLHVSLSASYNTALHCRLPSRCIQGSWAGKERWSLDILFVCALRVDLLTWSSSRNTHRWDFDASPQGDPTNNNQLSDTYIGKLGEF